MGPTKQPKPPPPPPPVPRIDDAIKSEEMGRKVARRRGRAATATGAAYGPAPSLAAKTLG